MKQYERLLKWQERTAKGMILSLLGVFLILAWSCTSLIYLLNSSYSIYFIVFISYVLPIIVASSFIFYKENKLGGMEERRGYIKIVQQGEKAIIEINNINKDYLYKNIQDFLSIYDNKNILEKDFSYDIKSIGSKMLLLFNKAIGFKSFAFLINYLSFIDEQKYDVVGRYPAELTAARINKPITRETKKNIMVFCKDNKKGDINSVYCYCDNGLFLKKYLYLNKFDNPPFYKYMQLIQQTPGFEYREMPNI